MSTVRRWEGGQATGPLGVEVAVVLPLALDKVRAFRVLSPTTVRLFMTNTAPSPMRDIVEAWNALERCRVGALRLVAVPGYPNGFALTRDMVADASPTSFDVQSPELVAALQALGPDAGGNTARLGPYLYATPIPGPTYLATILSRAVTSALMRASASAYADGLLQGSWNVAFSYCALTDRFSVSVTVPDVCQGMPRWDPGCGGPAAGASINANMCGVAPPVHPLAQVNTLGATFGGYLSQYMGFGQQLTVDVLFTESLIYHASSPRLQSTYARVRTGTPPTPAALATWLQDAFNTYCWPAFAFDIILPFDAGGTGGETRYTISFAGGNTTLAGLADALNALVEQQLVVVGAETVPLPITVCAVGCGGGLNECNAPSGGGAGCGPAVGASCGACSSASSEELGVSGDGFGLGSVACGCGFSVSEMEACHNGTNASVCRGLMATQVRGLSFHWTPASDADAPVAFGLDWTATAATMNPARVGYDARVYGAATVHKPVREGVTIPNLAPACSVTKCQPPLANVSVVYRQETGALAFATTPFAPFSGNVVSASSVDSSTTKYTVDTGAYRHGLHVGARVALSSSTTPLSQQLCFVVDVPTSTDLVLVRQAQATAGAPNFAAATTVTVAPLDTPPLALYMQATTYRKAGVPPTPLGFRACTYLAAEGGAVEIVTPGTVDLQADPYLYLGLSFQAGDAAPMTGEIFVPATLTVGGSNGGPRARVVGRNMASRLMFAKIVRASCKYRPEYDKQFAFEFTGSGQNLGYVRVALYNSDLTPYLTHGHDVSVTLKCEAKMSGIAFGMSGCGRGSSEDAVIGMSSLPVSSALGMGPLGTVDPFANGGAYGQSMTPIPGHGTAFYGAMA
jgi:hypothetical protein